MFTELARIAEFKIERLQPSQTNLALRRRSQWLENAAQGLKLRQCHQAIVNQGLSGWSWGTRYVSIVIGNEPSQIMQLDGTPESAQLSAGSQIAVRINRAAIAGTVARCIADKD